MRYLVILVAAITCGATSRAVAVPLLYGVTNSGTDNYSLVQVNASTGQATSLFAFNLPAGFDGHGLAYHAPSGKLLLESARQTGGGAFAVIDPVAKAANVVTITGLPAGETGCAAIEYDRSTGRILVSFGPDGTNNQRRIASVSLAGAVLQTTGTLSPADLDALNYNPATGQMVVNDGNNPPHTAISNVFGAPAYTTVANPPADVNIDDGSYADTGTYYAPNDATKRLLVLVGDSYQDVGAFSTTSPVVGLAFVPEPSTLAVFASLGLPAVFRRRRCPRLA